MRLYPAALATLLLIPCGCTHEHPLESATTTSVNLPTPSSALTLASFGTLHLDPVTLGVHATPPAHRQPAANDDLYWLDIGAFMQPDTFRVRRVEVTASELAITYRVTHPFPAPADPAGVPNGFSNRADLGIAGATLFLLDVPTTVGNTFFSDVVANTSLVTNADAYFRPAGLSPVSGYTANTFPYLALVDESGATGTRVDVTNGGEVTGNFGNDGWTRAEYGAGNTGWTGYGVLHQGQASERTLRVDLAALQAAGPLSLEVALVAKYNDPRGGLTPAEKKANRLPPDSADASRFAYRMPHGALDVERIAALPESGGFTTDTISASTLRFHVVDWDARATETAAADLAEDPSFTHVAAGESGTPAVAVCIPGVLGDASVVDHWDPTTVLDDDSAYGGDAGQDSGAPGDSLYYEKSVTKAAGSGQLAGSYIGLVRVTDPEPASLILPLDGVSLLPLSSNLPINETYQTFEVALTPAASGGWARTLSGAGNDLVNDVAVAADGSTYVGGNVLGMIDFGGGVRTPSGASDAFILKLDGDGAYVWDKLFGGTGSDQVNRLAVDSGGNILATGLFNIACDFGGGSLTAVGSTDIYIVKYTSAGGHVWSKAHGTTGADSGRGIAADTAGNVIVSGSAVGTLDLGGGPVVGAGLADGWLLKLTSAGTHVWDRRLMGSSIDFAQAVATNASGEVYVAGEARTVDFGLGSICTAGGADGYVAKYSPTGTIAWNRWWGSNLNDLVDGIAVDQTNGAVYVVGPFSNTVNFGGSNVNSAGGFDGYLVKYSTTGAYQWDYTVRTSSATQDRITGVALAANGDVTISGIFGNNVDFGGGERTHSTFVEDGFAVGLTATGLWRWDALFQGMQNQSPRAVAVDTNGDVRVAGTFQDTVDFDPGPAVLNFTATGGIDGFTLKLGGGTGRF